MLDVLALFAAAILFGGMVTFSFLFAPLVFTQLPAETAGRFIRGVFPWYYLFVLGLAGIGAALLAAGDPVAALVMAAVAAGGVVARQGLMPAINRARDRQLAGDPGAGRRFDRLHKGSVVLNLLQIVAAAWVLASLAP
ncbi:MAG: DUF4149 domain-containing protein [Paracoccaceae bacterium]